MQNCMSALKNDVPTKELVIKQLRTKELVSKVFGHERASTKK